MSVDWCHEESVVPWQGEFMCSYCLQRKVVLIVETKFRRSFSTAVCRGADKSLARPTSRCILCDGENITFDASLVLYIYIYIVLIFLQL